jgi:ribonuclease-3
MEDRAKALCDKLGLIFNQPELLQNALIHRSYLNEHKKEKLEHNERMEFLGDAVLELIVTEYLFLEYDKPEGELTNLRSSLVKGDNLTKVGQKIGLENYLFLSKGEARSQERSRNYLLANTIEAIIGAIYLDQGYEKAKDFVLKNIVTGLPRIIKNQLYRDAKSLFQEKAQEKLGITPSYKTISQSGPDHDKSFIVGAYLGKELVGEGVGKSKQEAQQSAANKSLYKKEWE